MKTFYRKLVAMLLAVICVVATVPAMQSRAETNGSASIGVSASQVAVGESFTVTVTLSTPKEMICQMNLYYDSSIVTGPDGGGGVISILETDNMAPTKSFSYTFTSKAQGTASFRLGDVVIGYMDGDSGTASASAAITVQNPAPVQPPEGYSDVSLSFLNTSLGQLDPAAGSWRLNADNGVTTFAIDARASYGTVSVSGPFDSLQPGENWFNIHVVAMDGTTARDYPICVVRAAAAAPASSEAASSSAATSSSSAESSTAESSSEEETETETEEPQKKIPVQLEDGSTLYGVDTLYGIELPKNFEEEKLVLESGSIAAAKDSRGLILVYLTDESGKNGAFYVWDESEKKAYPYVTTSEPEDSLVFLALPSGESIPDGYEATQLEVNGETITAYQKADTDDSLYLVYGMNEDGTAGWYRYDVENGSFFRYVSDTSSEELDALQAEHEKALAEKDQQIFRNRLLMTVFLVLTILLLIGFIAVQVLLLRAKKKQDELEDELDELQAAEPVDYLSAQDAETETTAETEEAQPEDLFEDTTEAASSEGSRGVADAADDIDAAPIVPEEEEVIDLAAESADAENTAKTDAPTEDDLEVIDLDKKEN